jgi:predicted site-specific integrase-resolvase
VAHGQALSDHLIHPGEVAEALALSPRTLDKLDRTGVLPKVRIPGIGVIRYRRSDVERLMSGVTETEHVVRRVVRTGTRGADRRLA